MRVREFALIFFTPPGGEEVGVGGRGGEGGGARLEMSEFILPNNSVKEEKNLQVGGSVRGNPASPTLTTPPTQPHPLTHQTP